MGSLFSSPKAPQVRPYIAPLPVNKPGTVEPVKTEKQISSDMRKQNLLRRTRGKTGTVLTSFSGYFDAQDANQESKKILLGE